MEEEEQGHSILELLVHGLVVPYLHAEPCPYASANGGKQEQGGFGYAPLSPFGFVLVNAVHDEGGGIDKHKIRGNNGRHHFSFLPSWKALPMRPPSAR